MTTTSTSAKAKTCRCCLVSKNETLFDIKQKQQNAHVKSRKNVCTVCAQNLTRLSYTDGAGARLCQTCGWYRPESEYEDKTRVHCTSCRSNTGTYMQRPGYPSTVSKAKSQAPQQFSQELTATVPQALPQAQLLHWDHLTVQEPSPESPAAEPIDRAQAVLWLCDQLTEARAERDAAVLEIENLGGELAFTQSKLGDSESLVAKVDHERTQALDRLAQAGKKLAEWDTWERESDQAYKTVEAKLIEQEADATKLATELYDRITELESQAKEQVAKATARETELLRRIEELEWSKPKADVVSKEEGAALSLLGYSGIFPKRRASQAS